MHNDIFLHVQTFQTHLPFRKALTSVNYREACCDELCHLQIHTEKLEMRGKATSALMCPRKLSTHPDFPQRLPAGSDVFSSSGAPQLLQLLPISLCQTHTQRHKHALTWKHTKGQAFVPILPVVLVHVHGHILSHGPSEQQRSSLSSKSKSKCPSALQASNIYVLPVPAKTWWCNEEVMSFHKVLVLWKGLTLVQRPNDKSILGERNAPGIDLWAENKSLYMFGSCDSISWESEVKVSLISTQNTNQ